MNKTAVTSNNNEVLDMKKTSRWERINRIIRDGVTRNMDHNDRYFANFIFTLGDYGAINTNCLTGIV